MYLATGLAVVSAFALAVMPSSGQSWEWSSVGTGGQVLWPMFGGMGKAMDGLCFSFVSQAALDDKTLSERLARTALAVSKTRSIRKADMILNDAQPQVDVDPENYEVRVDGELIKSEPAKELPLAQRYFLF